MPGSSSSSVQLDSKLFGVPLKNLCVNDGTKIPIKIEQLITKIEMYGLYSEGIYRKSGVNSKIKELKQKMSEKTTASEIDYQSYNVNVLANVLKSFLRDMPEPLLTFDRYDDFLRAADLLDVNVRVQTLLSLVKKIPPAHHALLERLIFHLALVAQQEKHNRMSASSLAIVFAPCVLRTNRLVPAQDSLNDIGRQTKCIETLITQKMLNVKNTLADIDTLDTAAHTANERLSTLRSSKVFSPEELAPRPSTLESDTEVMILEDHIQEIKKEKALLTSALPNLTRASSDDDLLTDMEGEAGSLDDLSTGKEKDSSSYTECKESKDSMESFGSTGESFSLECECNRGFCKTPKNKSFNLSMDSNTESLVLSYNLKDQNIGYIAHPGHHLSLDQSHSSTPKLSSSSASNIKLAGIPRWSSSQQNLSFIGIAPSISDSPKAAMRSMSSGYETSVLPSIIPPSSSQNIVCYNPSPSCNASKEKLNENSKKSNRNNKKKQRNVDDEPIMV